MDELALFTLPPPDWSQAWVAKFVSMETAAAWFARYHYLGTVPGSAWCYGIFAPDMVACVAIGMPANEHGVAAKYNLQAWEGNREIVRVAVHPDAPKNTASRGVALASRLHHRSTGHKWLFSYADTGQQHHGGIYQAVGAIYLGISEARPGYLLDGRPIHPRSVVARYGSHSAAMIAELQANGIAIERVQDLNAAKHLYILPIGNKETCRAIRQHLLPMTLPYPKRSHA